MAASLSIVALAAATHPVYLFGVDRAQPATLPPLLDAGWEGFPGTPLALIAVSVVTSAAVALFGRLDTIRAGATVVSSLVILLAATWLWEGFARIQSGTAEAALPVTGAVFATIGAIVMMSVGSYLWSFQRARTARPSTPAPRRHREASTPTPRAPFQPPARASAPAHSR